MDGTRDAPVEVRRIPGLRLLAGGHAALSDIVVESRDEIGVRSHGLSMLPPPLQASWKRVALTPNRKNEGAREDLRFRCAVLTTTHVRCRASACELICMQVPLHQFAFFVTLGRELTKGAWKAWRDECIAARRDVDHFEEQWWRAVRSDF